MAAFSPSAFYGGNSEACSESEDGFSDEDNYVAPSDTEESDPTEASQEENEDGRDGGNNQNNTGPRVTDWTAYLDNLPDLDPLPFTVANPGSQVSSFNVKCEMDYFQLFFTDQLIEQIVRETNRYARDKISSAGVLQQYLIWNDWEDVRVQEFKAFLGVIVNITLNPKSEQKEYFSNDLLKKMPFFPHVFKRKRFLLIFWMLHVAPSPHTSSGPPTRGSKIRDVVTYIDAKCREHCNAGPKICVYESTVGLKGRASFKCYNPQKPTKWGMRVYALADCQTGYISAFEPYYGSTTTDSFCCPELPFTCRIVLHLLEEVEQVTPGSGYHLYTDRFYTSPMLAEELLSHNILLTGTVMTNRKQMPQQLKKR
ncbi:piggyBac transposable element-derived protein 4 [Rhipicephalus microplus]|nr:piggyBac transposable element-derived protein 4-like [Rhipicephalus microplus]